MDKKKTEKTTPLMQQYFDIKEQYKDTLLFFQVGDFYELFFQDAKVASAHLAIALTKRGKNNGKDIPLCGIPVHALNHYLTKLIKGGYRVAICDQLSKPQPGTIVDRGVSRVFTPATLTDTTMLDEKSASYLLSFFPGSKNWGLLFGELLTAQLFATTIPSQETRMLETELIRFFPDEIILPQTKAMHLFEVYFKKSGYSTSFTNQPTNTEDKTNPATIWLDENLCDKTQSNLSKHPIITQNLQTLYWYLKKNNKQALEQFKTIHFYQPDDYLILDVATQKNLEIVKNNQDGGRKNSLFAVLDRAKTAMGSRTIKKWLLRPLVQGKAIGHRQEVVATLCSQVDTLQQLSELLGRLADIERIIGRVALQRTSVHDLLALKGSLDVVPSIKNVLSTQIKTQLSNLLFEKIADFSPLFQLLECSINDNPSRSETVKLGYNHQLDKLRNLLANGQQEILKLEKKEIERTNIASLKIGYNQVSGYYIEVTKPNLSKVPDNYIHQQTLATRKRFVTKELKELEQDIFKAQNDLETIERHVFDQIKKEIETYLPQLRHLAGSLAYLDALFGFATAAYEFQYTSPTFNNQRNIIIKGGRHPVVEQALNGQFIPNDTLLSDTQSTLIITGPNMGGKSTYLRQVALMCIMAQCGSFLPAQKAELPILDRIFTRIGSGDNLAEGKSTFLVEMEETATICTQATKHSLVILDEVGRGTSTHDGIALAQAIVEYIHRKIQARCLFATHYHELTHLQNVLKGIANYNTACKKQNETIIFLHKIMVGTAQGSFGLEVAKLAHLPNSILQRAAIILKKLNLNSPKNRFQQTVFEGSSSQELPNSNQEEIINSLEAKIQEQEEILHHLRNIDYDNLTPKQAFDLLWKLSQK